MQSRYHIIILLALMVLTLGGLNLAHQGLNELTLGQYPPVFGLYQDEEDLVFCIVGQVHTVEGEEIQQWQSRLRSFYEHIKAFLQYWWSAFRHRESQQSGCQHHCTAAYLSCYNEGRDWKTEHGWFVFGGYRF